MTNFNGKEEIMTDAEIVKIDQNTYSDPDSWVQRHGDYLYAYAMFRLHDRTAAEDIVQETLLAALQSRHAFARESTERTWLTGILKHKIIDSYRRACRENNFDGFSDPEILERQLFDESGHWRESRCPNEWNSDAEFLFEQREFEEVFQKCLGELPRRLACVFTLREIDGMTNAEICEILEISRNNFWTMLHRARVQLRYLLDQNWFQNESAGVSQAIGAKPAKLEFNGEIM